MSTLQDDILKTVQRGRDIRIFKGADSKYFRLRLSDYSGIGHHIEHQPVTMDTFQEVLDEMNRDLNKFLSGDHIDQDYFEGWKT